MASRRGRKGALDTIKQHFYAIRGSLQAENAVHQYDRNTILEPIFCGLLNLIFGWLLCNQNDFQMNAAGIDFADTSRRISVQLSSRATAKKVRDTLDAFFQHDLHLKYDKLYVVFMDDGRPKIKDYSKNLKHGFHFDRDEHILDLKELYRKIDRLDTDKVNAIADFLNKEMEPLLQVLDEALPNLPQVSDFFITDSRAKQIAALAPLMQTPDLLVLWGEGGIGKTQIALKLVKDYSPRRGAGYIKYIQYPPNGEESMFASILAADFHGGPFEDRDPNARKQEFQKRLEILAQRGEEAVLIIDDFWRHGCKLHGLMEESSFGRLLQTNIHLVLTTRFPYINSKIPEGQPDPGHIETLDCEQLMAQIRWYSKNQTLTNDHLRPLLEAAECNTLAAYLICETLRDGSVFPEELQTLFTDGVPGDLDLPVFTDEYGKNEGNIIEHLARLHDLSILDDVTRQTLALALLACPGKFKLSAFKRSLADPVYRKCFEQLRLSGWIDSRDGSFRVMPMVRLAHRNSLMPAEGILSDFREKLCTQWDNPDLTDEDRAQICTCCGAAKQLLPNCDPVCPRGQVFPINTERGG